MVTFASPLAIVRNNLTHLQNPPVFTGGFFYLLPFRWYNYFMIYLDGAATSPLLPEAKKAMFDAHDAPLGNSSSLHSAGVSSSNLIEKARESVAHLIGAKPHEIIFTSGATESNNTVMHIFAGKNIWISPYEHHSVTESARHYGKKVVMGGDFSSSDLISHILASHETGEIFSLPEKTSALQLHSDLTSALGKIPINVKKLRLDYATFSAHKIGGPIGIGALYVRNLGEDNGAPFTPLLYGGHQESGYRAGTPPTPLIAGFGAAAEYLDTQHVPDLYREHIRRLRDQLAQRILAEIPGSVLNTPLDHSLPNLLNVSFRGAEGESIQLSLDMKRGIIVGTGSACASGEPSETLLHMFHDPERAHSSIRFSLPLTFTQPDIEKILASLKPTIKKLQGISTI